MEGIPFILVSSDPEDTSRHSRLVREFVLVPGFKTGDQADTVATLVGIATRFGRRLPLIYGADPHLDMLFSHRATLEKHFLFLTNDEADSAAMFNKELFSDYCLQRGVSAPRTVVPKGVEDLEKVAISLREPLLVKPRRKTNWKALQKAIFSGIGKARVFDTRAALVAHEGVRTFASELIVQEHLGGDPRDLYSFHGFADRNGRILGSFCGRKVRTYPSFAGESSCIELAANADVDTAGREMASKLGLVGPFKIDMILDRGTNGFAVLEVNCRYTLWNYLGAAEGVNLPAIAYRYLVDGHEPPDEARIPAPSSRKWVNLYRDLRTTRVGREIGIGRWLHSVATPGTLYEVFAWRDPVPALFWLRDFVRARVTR